MAEYRARHKQKNSSLSSTSTYNSKPSTSRQQVDGPLVSSAGQSKSSPSKITKNINEYISVVNPKGLMAAKLEAAAPYNYFLTTITDSKPTHREPLSITFQGKLNYFKL